MSRVSGVHMREHVQGFWGLYEGACPGFLGYI